MLLKEQNTLSNQIGASVFIGSGWFAPVIARFMQLRQPGYHAEINVIAEHDFLKLKVNFVYGFDRVYNPNI